jgi:hypothetical protein
LEHDEVCHGVSRRVDEGQAEDKQQQLQQQGLSTTGPARHDDAYSATFGGSDCDQEHETHRIVERSLDTCTIHVRTVGDTMVEGFEYYFRVATNP